MNSNQPQLAGISLLSVVVIGRNEGERLRACLSSVQRMSRGDFAIEVIYVDSGSSDGSVVLAESMGMRSILLNPVRPSAALARNAGWNAARGEIVLFLDGDTVLDADFVQASLPEFVDPAVAVVWGHRREAYPERAIYNRVMDLDWIYAAGPSQFCGGDALMRRSMLAVMKGFDATLIAGEEPELCRRLLNAGYRIEHIDHPMTLHDLAITRFGQYWTRAMRAGHAYAEVSERFANTPSPFWMADAKRNRNRTLTLCAFVFASIATAAVMRSALPLLIAMLLLLVLITRTAWGSRWKSSDASTLMMYGLHSHLQQIPIYCGQLQYRWNRRRGGHARLMEYKRP